MRSRALVTGALLSILPAALLARQAAQPPPARPAAESQQQAQQPPPPPQDPQRADQPIRTGINYVRVDVIVTDPRTGEPVLDLKPEEFSLAEDGKPQKIESFSVVRIDPAAQVDQPIPEIRSKYDEEREAARPDVRLFIILLDDYHVRRGGDLAIREPLTQFIQNSLSPLDMVAIMYPLTPVRDLTFTRNHDSLIRAIETFEGRRFNYQPRNQFEEQYAQYPVAVVERIRNEVVMSALRGAAVRLGGMREGRKSIIFVSEGFTGVVPAQLNDPVASMPGFGNPARRQPGTEASNERAEFLNKVDMTSDLNEIFREANRNNTSIYVVDPRGLAAFEYDINQGVGIQTDARHLRASLDTLRELADNTDGRAIINRNDLGVGMKQIIRDSSGYYLLGYNSSQAPSDGKFHEIKVRASRRGVDVRARRGYWAYTAEDVARATAPPKPEMAPAMTAALSSIAEPIRGRAARFWVGTGPGDQGKTRVTFVWEPVAAGPGERRSEDAVPLRVMVTATTPDGRPVFRGRVPDTAAAPADGGASTQAGTTGAAQGAPAGASTTFDAPPGPLRMRMMVEDASGQVIDSAMRELTLPDFSAVEVSLGTPRVYRARNAREAQNIRSNPHAAPAVERTFSRTERLLVRASAHAPGGEAPSVSARLLNRGGTAMSDLPVKSADGVTEIDLPLSSLAAGDYLIEINAKAQAGTAQEYVGFRIAR